MSAWPFGWEAVDLPMLAALPVLLLLSGLFSGSETALFGLGEAQRMQLRTGSGLGGRAVDTLLRDPGMLLITILLANTTINVGYFVTSSVLLMHSDLGPAGQAAMAVAFLVIIVLSGEVLPKAIADAHRIRLAPILAPPLLTFHTVIGPLRIVLGRWIIAPLARLVVPHAEDASVGDDELRSLLDLSGHEGVIDDHEHRLLAELLELRLRKVRDVMTPRVRMVALPHDADRGAVSAFVREHRQLTIPVYEGNLDRIVGALHVKRYLMDRSIDRITDPRVLSAPRFVPEVATLDQLLERFRTWHTRAAVVVDEYGGTEGTVSVEDVVEEIVGDIFVGRAALAVPEPRLVGLDEWLVSGRWSIHDFAESFGLTLGQPEFSTVGGLVADRLGRAACVGDRVTEGDIQIRVKRMDGSRISEVRITRRPVPTPPAPEESP